VGFRYNAVRSVGKRRRADMVVGELKEVFADENLVF
jgi:hypothetical protein